MDGWRQKSPSFFADYMIIVIILLLFSFSAGRHCVFLYKKMNLKFSIEKVVSFIRLKLKILITSEMSPPFWKASHSRTHDGFRLF